MLIRPYTAADHTDLERLVWAYRDLLIERTSAVPGIVETYYAKADYARLVEDLPRIHARPKGDILLAEHADSIVGCGMYYPLPTEGTCEIKRVYVTPDARGLGAGRAIMKAGIEAARADGYRRMVLDTMVDLTEAIALYEALGFTPAPPFYEVDPRYVDVIQFFEISI